MNRMSRLEEIKRMIIRSLRRDAENCSKIPGGYRIHSGWIKSIADDLERNEGYIEIIERRK
jgi:hypothetical protein